MIEIKDAYFFVIIITYQVLHGYVKVCEVTHSLPATEKECA